MELARPVHPGLAGLVERVTAYEHHLDPAAVHFGVPSTSLTVILSLTEPLDVAWADGDAERGHRWRLVSGLHTVPAFIRTHGVQVGIQIALTPAGSRALLGIPAAEVAHTLADACSSAFPPELTERLVAQPSWDGRLELLERHLLQLAAVDGRHQTMPDDLAHAWREVRRTHGATRVSHLAREVGWSRRHLLNRFQGEFGVTPTQLMQLNRFGLAQRLGRGTASWAQIAASAGYADQAHLSREFRRFAGVTPTQWRAERFPVVQDVASVFGSGWGP